MPAPRARRTYGRLISGLSSINYPMAGKKPSLTLSRTPGSAPYALPLTPSNTSSWSAPTLPSFAATLSPGPRTSYPPTLRRANSPLRDHSLCVCVVTCAAWFNFYATPPWAPPCSLLRPVAMSATTLHSGCPGPDHPALRSCFLDRMPAPPAAASSRSLLASDQAGPCYVVHPLPARQRALPL